MFRNSERFGIGYALMQSPHSHLQHGILANSTISAGPISTDQVSHRDRRLLAASFLWNFYPPATNYLSNAMRYILHIGTCLPDSRFLSTHSAFRPDPTHRLWKHGSVEFPTTLDLLCSLFWTTNARALSRDKYISYEGFTSAMYNPVISRIRLPPSYHQHISHQCFQISSAS